MALFFESATRKLSREVVDSPSDRSNYKHRKLHNQQVTEIKEAAKLVDTFLIHDPGIPQLETGKISAKRALEITVDELTIKGKNKSAHWTLSHDGTLYKHVNILYSAWHAGDSILHGKKWLNNISVGIEVIGSPYTEIQYFVLAQLINDVRQIFPLINPTRIIGHYHVSSYRGKVDPRNFDFEKLFRIMYTKRPVE